MVNLVQIAPQKIENDLYANEAWVFNYMKQQKTHSISVFYSIHPHKPLNHNFEVHRKNERNIGHFLQQTWIVRFVFKPDIFGLSC